MLEQILIGTMGVLIGAFIPAFVKPYLSQKGKNLADKEDIQDITRKVEQVKAELQVQSSYFLQKATNLVTGVEPEY
jgi:hypothetical protein